MKSAYNVFNICDGSFLRPVKLEILINGEFVHYLVSMIKNDIVELESVNLKALSMQRGRYEEVIVVPIVLYNRIRGNYKSYIFASRRSI